MGRDLAVERSRSPVDYNFITKTVARCTRKPVKKQQLNTNVTPEYESSFQSNNHRLRWPGQLSFDESCNWEDFLATSEIENEGRSSGQPFGMTNRVMCISSLKKVHANQNLYSTSANFPEDHGKD